MKVKNVPASELIDKLPCHLQCFSKTNERRARHSVQFSKDASDTLASKNLQCSVLSGLCCYFLKPPKNVL